MGNSNAHDATAEFGVGETELATVVPGFGRFSPALIGFL